MKKSLIALAFGTLGLGIAEFTMMGILPYVAADLNIGIPVAGHFISAYALGVCAGAPMLILARKRPLKHILLAFGFNAGRKPGGCDGHRLLVAAGGAFHFGFAARGVFRSRFHCGGQAGGRGEKLRGRIHYDSGHDGCQSVRRSAGYFPEPYTLVACHVLAGGLLGSDSPLLYMAVGSCGGGTERYRVQGTVPFPEDSRSLADIGGDGFGQWRRVLLV